MPCANPSVPTAGDQDLTDFYFVHPLRATRVYQPRDRAELVAAVLQTARLDRSLRAHGSNWSLSEAGIAEDIVDTRALERHVSLPFPNAGSPLPDTRLRDGGGEFLARACALDAHTNGRYFVHVEAGVKLHQLLDDLARCGLALPTAGDVAGQSLLGAISTGTHGGDLRVPPLVEWIRAVHLVTATGREAWVTPSSGPFGVPALVSALPGWCPDARLIADDDMFDGVRLGVGRMGVVYAVVLEVVAQYTLVQVNMGYWWDEIRAQLPASRVGPTSVSGLFDRPLVDLDSGWFRDEVLKRARYDAENSEFRFVRGPAIWPSPPAYFDRHPDVYPRLLARLGLTSLAEDLRGRPPSLLHHLNIGIPLTKPELCWVRRRWKQDRPVRTDRHAARADPAILAAVKANKTNPAAIVEPLRDMVQLSGLEHFFGWLTHDPRRPRLEWFMDVEFARIAQLHADLGLTSGEALMFAIHGLATDPVLKNDTGPAVADVAANVIGGAFSVLAQAGFASGPLGRNMLDTHDYDLEGAQAGNAIEVHFNAAATDYLAFIEDLGQFARNHFPVLGYIGLRFTPAASALVAMQQYPLTASVEVATLRSRAEDIYADFWDDVHAAARARRGIPHWGEEMRHSASELAALYGDRLRRWRDVLAAVCDGAPAVFSTSFSREKGLEPSATPRVVDDEAVELFMMALAAADF